MDLRRGAHDPPFLAFLRLQICDQGAISQQMFSFPTPASAAEKSGEKQPKVLKAQMFGTVSCSKLRTVGPAKRPPPPGRPAPPSAPAHGPPPCSPRLPLMESNIVQTTRAIRGASNVQRDVECKSDESAPHLYLYLQVGAPQHFASQVV